MDERGTGCEEGRLVLAATIALDHLVRSAVMADRNALTKGQTDALLGLAVMGDMNMTQVSEHIAASKEQATRVVAPLVEAGLVARRRDPDNYRSVVVSLTDEGRRVFEESSGRAAALVGGRLAGLAEADRERLAAAAREIVDVLHALGGEDEGAGEVRGV